MDGSVSLREENAERRVFCCASLRYGSGVEVVASEIEAFRMSFAASPVVDTSAECRCRREECGGMTGLEFEALQLKIVVK